MFICLCVFICSLIGDVNGVKVLFDDSDGVNCLVTNCVLYLCLAVRDYLVENVCSPESLKRASKLTRVIIVSKPTKVTARALYSVQTKRWYTRWRTDES